MLTDFYGFFSTVSFTLMGLWFVVVQTRHADWAGSDLRRRRATAVTVQLALPGLMSLVALVDANSQPLWRATFAVVAILGALMLVALGTGAAAPARARTPEVARLVGVVLYLLVALVAVAPRVVSGLRISLAPVRVEALLLSALLILGVAVAWYLMFEPATPVGRSGG